MREYNIIMSQLQRQDTKKDPKKDGKMTEKSSTTNNQQIQSKLLGANVNEINIEKLRESKAALNYNLNGKLQSQILKTISNKFSTDVIFTLDLSNQKLTSIEPLQECTKLIMLNISNNQITSLNPLQRMTDLAFLNVSCNAISALDLGELCSLQSLQAKGNQVKILKQIEQLGRLAHLRTLYLQSPTGMIKNPICDAHGYRNQVFQTVKQIQRLDGYQRDQQPYNGTELKQEGPQVKMELPNVGPWYAQNFPKIEVNNIQINEDQKARSNLDESRKLISNIEMKLSLLT